eukprot:1909461-Rhodomonas_salina.5
MLGTVTACQGYGRYRPTRVLCDARYWPSAFCATECAVLSACVLLPGRLTELLEACTKLETIDLSWNCIDSEGVRRFAPGLQQTSALHTLALTDNNIGTAGARYLAELLPSLKSLRFLRLSLTDIRSEGLAEIGEA